MATEKVTDSAVVFLRRAWYIELAATCRGGEGLCFCVFACVLFPLIHLLLESPRLFLVDKRQAGHTLFEFKGMEKSSVLVILEGIVDFLIPNYASACRRDVDQLDPESVPDKVVAEDGGALKARIGPSVSAGESNIEPSDSDSLDLVGSLGYGPLDDLLFAFTQYGRHGGGRRRMKTNDMVVI
jgi:hypothetical protein